MISLRDYLMGRYAREARREIGAVLPSFPEEDRLAFVERHMEMLKLKVEQLERRTASLPVEDDAVHAHIDRAEVERIHTDINRGAGGAR